MVGYGHGSDVQGGRLMHGVYKCTCGRKLAGCNCPNHQNLINKIYPSCVECIPIKIRDTTKPLKEQMDARFKDDR